jgi:hypothetical protein
MMVGIAFTPPPGRTRKYNQWTTGSLYYSTLVITEALGSSNNSQVLDLFPNNGNQLTPAYGIYENGQPSRLVLINYINDPSGASDLTVTVQLPQGFDTSAVNVRYLLTPGKSVADKTNFTWAGQTLGDRFQCDGRLYGDVVTTPVPCDGGAATCQVKVPASSVALVFFSQSSLKASTPTPEEATATFSTTVFSKLHHTATVPQAVLQTSNGRGGLDSDTGKLGSTSQQQQVNFNAAVRKSGALGLGGIVIALGGAALALLIGL